MPKKKTGARKKAEKQKQRQKDIQQGSKNVPITKFPCNFVMVRILLCILKKKIHLIVTKRYF